MNELTVSVFTVGHSTRALEEFTGLLRKYGIARLADVRTVPRSRHNPQFNRESLPEALAAAGIEYIHLPELGGFRHARPDSPNTGWRNASFRGFADYMQTDEFRAGLEKLIALAEGATTAVMCAEAGPWRCHRSLIADALTARGVVVQDILDAETVQPHRMTPIACVNGSQVMYPAVKLSGKIDAPGN